MRQKLSTSVIDPSVLPGAQGTIIRALTALAAIVTLTPVVAAHSLPAPIARQDALAAASTVFVAPLAFAALLAQIRERLELGALVAQVLPARSALPHGIAIVTVILLATAA